jgi:hypothetical protein
MDTNQLSAVLSPDGWTAARNIEAALRQPADAAASRARRMELELDRYRGLARNPRAALRALLAIDDPLPAADRRWLLKKENGPFVLSLPLTLPALAVIARLFDTRHHFLCIEETPLTMLLLGFLTELHKGRRAMMAQASGLIRHRRLATQKELSRTVFVTFPDHHRSTEGTSRVVPFFGGEHYVPITEPLLYFRGVSPVVTFAPAASGNGLALARYEVRPNDPVTEEDAVELLTWLMARIETFVQAGTHDLLSWTVISHRTRESFRVNRAVDARMVEAFLRAWKDDAGVIGDDLFAWSAGELARIHASSRTTPKELR